MNRRSSSSGDKLLFPRRAAVLFLLFAGAMTLIHLWQFSYQPISSQDTLALTKGNPSMLRRSLHTAPVLSRSPSQLHSFLVLDSDPSGARTMKDLQPSLDPYRQYPEAVTITLITGVVATSLAAQFSIPAASLPAVVYVPPMWQSDAGFREASTFSLSKHAAGDFSSWARSKSRLTLLLMNDWHGNEDVCFYYVNSATKEEVELGCPAMQVELWQEVSMLDTFTARNKTGHALLARHVALFSGIFAVHPPDFCNYLLDSSCYMAKPPVDENDPAVRNYELLRPRILRDQPKLLHHYTPLGFELRRAPEEVYQILSSYLNASWDNLVMESWPDDDLKATLPEPGPMKARLFKLMQGVLEEWIGGLALVPTAIYGIRIYDRNSSLAMHCDKLETHVISGIINVHQEVEEPWPLQILDHAGQLHSINMKPGDLVMYEGATCGHGRVNPLKGRFYANVFVHFKPKNPIPVSSR